PYVRRVDAVGQLVCEGIWVTRRLSVAEVLLELVQDDQQRRVERRGSRIDCPGQRAGRRALRRTSAAVHRREAGFHVLVGVVVTVRRLAGPIFVARQEWSALPLDLGDQISYRLVLP